ncbi:MULTISPECIES: DUF2946 domain-containing protein [unclassified Pseudomonas]|uniref:DUF2946 domain-containing protein n=1 Tax=unclassified Pseudomonas TaxID=196821 RepID=UPI0021156A6A|nr:MULTISPECIES: DUF2946 domain-containing protein [unclassified Pseudomonas]
MADMKPQQYSLPSQKRRRTFAWIACFALLFGMLAMPITPTMPRIQGEQWVWSSFCTGQGTKWVATPVALVDQGTPTHNDHTSVQHCPCCSGALSMVAVPAGNQLGFLVLVQPVHLQDVELWFHAPPRVLWPHLNPRASPRV